MSKHTPGCPDAHSIEARYCGCPAGRMLRTIAEVRAVREGDAEDRRRDVLRERLADLAHQQWSGWMHYLFGKCDQGPNGALVIPAWAVERWRRQCATPYADLSPDEQDSDRKEADKFLAAMRDALAVVGHVARCGPFPLRDAEDLCSSCEGFLDTDEHGEGCAWLLACRLSR